MKTIIRCAAALLLAGFTTLAAQVALTGISIPFVDSAGRTTHRLSAKRGTLLGGVERLEDVEIVFYSAGTAPNEVQRVRAAEATIDRKKNTLAGNGAISVDTEESKLTGEGFDFALQTAVLEIHRRFRMSNPDVVMTSERATAWLEIEGAGERAKFRDVKRCEARDNLHLVFTNPDRKKYPYDEAFSEIALYDGRARTLTLPRAVRALRDGAESTIGEVSYQLRPK